MKPTVVVRTFLISPEIVALLAPFALMPYAGFIDSMSLLLDDHKFELFAAAAYPFAVLLYAVGRVSDIIAPSGKRAVLLEWSDYDLLKGTALISIALISLSLIISMCGYFVFIVNGGRLGVTAIAAGALGSSVTAFTLVLAHWKSREILGE